MEENKYQELCLTISLVGYSDRNVWMLLELDPPQEFCYWYYMKTSAQIHSRIDLECCIPRTVIYKKVTPRLLNQLIKRIIERSDGTMPPTAISGRIETASGSRSTYYTSPISGVVDLDTLKDVLKFVRKSYIECIPVFGRSFTNVIEPSRQIEAYLRWLKKEEENNNDKNNISVWKRIWKFGERLVGRHLR